MESQQSTISMFVFFIPHDISDRHVKNAVVQSVNVNPVADERLSKGDVRNVDQIESVPLETRMWFIAHNENDIRCNGAHGISRFGSHKNNMCKYQDKRTASDFHANHFSKDVPLAFKLGVHLISNR